jgi:hypothetical protein
MIVGKETEKQFFFGAFKSKDLVDFFPFQLKIFFFKFDSMGLNSKNKMNVERKTKTIEMKK